MAFPYISGLATAPPPAPVELPNPERLDREDPQGYLMDPDLAAAANVALLLGQPLLLMGEPGTGKTQLAHRLAWELGYGEPLVFNTKSTSSARDLFYMYDAIGRFQAAQAEKQGVSALDFLNYQALGLAILRAADPDRLTGLLPQGYQAPPQPRSVVLIDEIDKAPRDFPNDLLHEIREFSFRIPELANAEVKAGKAKRPVVVITSNSERNLPEAFLRRCVFYSIPYPDAEQLARIVQSRLGVFSDLDSQLLKSAIDFFEEVRKLGLHKPPATAELIDWLQVLQALGVPLDQPLANAESALRASSSVLAKNQEDGAIIAQFITRYVSTRPAA